MAKRHLALAVAIAALLIVLSAPVQALLAPPVLLCNMTQAGLEACELAVTARKKIPATPPPACCAALAEADLACLCAFKRNNLSLLKYLKIDPRLASKLPARCRLASPPKC
ncbi:unnamed protein product [Spirodela intermedia]|uniref:Bifunctional inhibitor/plant lipid transfer protein/seed storage helical domain-containing protein n=1 Tax=Spirodela intermedia TaxID=51605 RepID=A0A7I8L571_SPIIN|nr:unnamed protein product [Spirodela intermedia]